ncbi:MAG: Skp family chaperone for outer membrane protein [Verrucomicrobiales bacterium]|jgi:Skp family chaperone for outer membrane proteins
MISAIDSSDPIWKSTWASVSVSNVANYFVRRQNPQMRWICLSLFPLLCSLVFADENPNKSQRPNFGIVNVTKVYESSLSAEQKAILEEERKHLRAIQKCGERNMRYWRRIMQWQEIQKEIAATNVGETATLQEQASRIETELKTLERETNAVRHRRERALAGPSGAAHRSILACPLQIGELTTYLVGNGVFSPSEEETGKFRYRFCIYLL